MNSMEYTNSNTVNSPNNGHFGDARPTVRYSGGVLYWGIIVRPHITSLLQVPCKYKL